MQLTGQFGHHHLKRLLNPGERQFIPSIFQITPLTFFTAHMKKKSFLVHCMPGITALIIIVLLTTLSSCHKEKDPDPPISVGFGVASQSVNEGAEVNITILLDKPVLDQGTVTVSITGTAHYTTDYNTNPSGNSGSFQVALLPGQSSAVFSLASVPDQIFTDSRTVIFTLSGVTDGFQLNDNKVFTATILDDESPAVANFEIATAAIDENNTDGITVHIPFSNPAKGEGSLTISFASNNATGENFTMIPELNGNTVSITIPDEAASTAFTIVPKDDSYFHADYVLVFEISATGGALRTGTNKKFTLTIQEDELPSLATFDASTSQTAENGSPVTIQIPLSIPASNTGVVTVSYASTNATYGTNFTTTPAVSATNIVIPVAKDATQVEFTVTPVDDEVDNTPRIITFTISATDGVVKPGAATVHILTITDNEPSLRRILISFGTAAAPSVFGNDHWNEAYTNTPNGTYSLMNLVRSDGVATGLNLVVVTPLTPQDRGKVTGLNSGPFPDNALKEYWYVPGPDQGITRGFQITQADNAITYKIRAMGNTTATSTDGKNTMTMAVNGVEKVIDDVTNNLTQLMEWAGVMSSASIITVDLTDTDGGGICPLNVMEISWFEED